MKATILKFAASDTWQAVLALLSLFAVIAFGVGYYRGWDVRELVFWGFMALYLDPTDGMTLRKVSRWLP